MGRGPGPTAKGLRLDEFGRLGFCEDQAWVLGAFVLELWATLPERPSQHRVVRVLGLSRPKLKARPVPGEQRSSSAVSFSTVSYCRCFRAR